MPPDLGLPAETYAAAKRWLGLITVTATIVLWWATLTAAVARVEENLTKHEALVSHPGTAAALIAIERKVDHLNTISLDVLCELKPTHRECRP